MLKYALALATAGLLVLTYPGTGLAFLAPVAIAPLLYAVAREPRGWKRFLLGYAAGIAFWAGSCYWIQFVLEHYAGMSAVMAWLGFAGFLLYKSLQLGAFAWLAGPAMRTRWAILAVPALWVAIEWTHAFSGFSWLLLGNAGIDMNIPMRLAPYTGVWGLSFVFAVTGTALALVALRRPRRELIPLAALPLVLVLPALPAPQRGTETAVLVQPNISESADWTPQWVERQQQKLLRLSAEAALKQPGRTPALIVWPEAPAPIYYADDPRIREQINELAKSTGAYVVFNSAPRNAKGEVLNSAVIVGPTGQPLGQYDKMNLVPFGEFVPWPFRSLVSKISTEAGDFAAGTNQTVLPAGAHNVGAFVCYESVLPGFVRKFADEGAEVYVNISNDGWFGRSAARDQHLAIARMRAAENRRWILRATNDGVTATIDPAGRVWRQLPSFVPGAVETGFSWISGTTFYSRHGDWLVWLCMLGAAAGIAAGWRKPALAEAKRASTSSEPAD